MPKARPQPSATISLRMYVLVVIAVRKDPVTWDTDLSGGLTDRGYTMHSLFRPFGKHLDDFGLINMNGRVYDPLLGRFLSPDNHIQAPDNPQNYNRYAYALNNPLKYTDPSGEFIFLFPNISWSKEGGFGVGLSLVVGVPGVASLQTGLNYNFKTDTPQAYMGASFGFNSVTAIASPNGLSVSYSAGLSKYSGVPISTNFLSTSVNYNIDHNTWSGNISAYNISKKDGWTFDPSLSAMIYPEQFTNFVRKGRFIDNNAMLKTFTNASDYQGALDYFGFEGSYVNTYDYTGLTTFRYGKVGKARADITYGNGAFSSYGQLFYTNVKEMYHYSKYIKGGKPDIQTKQELKNAGFYLSNMNKKNLQQARVAPEEVSGFLYALKRAGLYGESSSGIIRNISSSVNNTYGSVLINPPPKVQVRFWYTVPRKW